MKNTTRNPLLFSLLTTGLLTSPPGWSGAHLTDTSRPFNAYTGNDGFIAAFDLEECEAKAEARKKYCLFELQRGTVHCRGKYQVDMRKCKHKAKKSG
ncbi:MAG: hypothetical protein CSB48_02320 [Proteobacteria bacterium]|nr:MAG: hypothetical protein CSB48_02320 [Pseudomonadota bacterium]